MKKFKPGDYCRFTTEEIPTIIALLKANGWEVENENGNIIGIGVVSDPDFIENSSAPIKFIPIYKNHKLTTELSKHGFMVTAIRLNEGDGMRSDMSTQDQRQHIAEVLEKLGVAQHFMASTRTHESYWSSFSFSSNIWVGCNDATVKNHIDYLDWCKRLNIEPIGMQCDEACEYHCTMGGTQPKDCVNHLPDSGEKVDEKTIRNYQMDYPESARAIHLYLKEFCDESLSFPNMIADASRKASEEIERLRNNQTLTLPDGTTVDLTKPIQGLFDGSWFDVLKYIGMSTENEFVCEAHNVFDTSFTEFKHIRNKPEEVKVDKNVLSILPSHAYITKKALEVFGDDDNDLILEKHKSWIEGGVFILAECVKFLKDNGLFDENGKPQYPPFKD